MREDGRKVREGRELDIGANEGVESSGRADIDACKDRDEQAADQRCIERIVHLAVDAAKPAAEGGGIVPRKRPESSAGGDVAADAGDQGGQKRNDQQAESTSSRPGCLAVDLS